MNREAKSSLPLDRSHLLTEQRNPHTLNLHELSVPQLVAVIGDEDREVIRAITAARPTLIKYIEAVEPGFLRGGRLIYIGAGTSGRLGVLDASECPPTFQTPPSRVVGIIAGGDSALRRSSEGREDDPEGSREELEKLHLTTDDAIFGIAAGGTTPYVLGALDISKRLCPRTITGLLVCSQMERPVQVDFLVIIETGPEVLTGSTRMKAGTATKLVLNTISTALMIRSGRVYQNLMVDLRATNSKLRDRAARIVTILTGLDREASFQLLEEAGGAVKTAVVMRLTGRDRISAEEHLASCGNRLYKALVV
ncbi:MAG: N-acetylmuramic acid 6-phosphate etherase [Calditrichota bacterium]